MSLLSVRQRKDAIYLDVNASINDPLKDLSDASIQFFLGGYIVTEFGTSAKGRLGC